MPSPIRVYMPFVLLLCLGACLPAAAPERGPVEGAWRVARVVGTGADTSWTLTSPQPSLYLFGKRHYSIMYVPGTQARAVYQGGQPTDAEKIAAYDSFVANTGTYEIEDSVIKTRPIVARVPSFMMDGYQNFRFETSDDTLRLTAQAASFWLEPPPVVITTTLIRLE